MIVVIMHMASVKHSLTNSVFYVHYFYHVNMTPAKSCFLNAVLGYMLSFVSIGMETFGARISTKSTI